MFAENKLLLLVADLFGCHNFVGRLVFHHAVLMYACLVQKCVFADDCLVRLNDRACHRADRARRRHDKLRVYARFRVVEIVADV